MADSSIHWSLTEKARRKIQCCDAFLECHEGLCFVVEKISFCLIDFWAHRDPQVSEMRFLLVEVIYSSSVSNSHWDKAPFQKHCFTDFQWLAQVFPPPRERKKIPPWRTSIWIEVFNCQKLGEIDNSTVSKVIERECNVNNSVKLS